MTSNCTNTKEINDSETPWIFIESYFKQKHLKQLVKHQLESYNYFVNNQIQNTIDMFNQLIITSEIPLLNIAFYNIKFINRIISAANIN